MIALEIEFDWIVILGTQLIIIGCIVELLQKESQFLTDQVNNFFKYCMLEHWVIFTMFVIIVKQSINMIPIHWNTLDLVWEYGSIALNYSKATILKPRRKLSIIIPLF